MTAGPGTSQEDLRRAVAAALPEGFEATTGDAASARAANRIDEALSFVTTFLLVFAGVALTVGAFLIVNTFSILVAQRSRELALLRAIGASRRQVARSVLAEASIVGVIGSAVGIALGFVLAIGIRMLFGRIGLDLSASELVLRPRTVAVALTVGLLVTLASAYLPARRAGRVSPVAAMRDDVALAESGLRWRIVVGCLLLVAGITGMAARPGGRRLGTDLRPGRRHIRRPRRDRAAEPRARPAGAVGTRLALPPRVRRGGPHGRAERPAEPPPDRRDGIRPDDRCRARDDDGGARGVGEGEPRPDPRRGHRRRLRRVECRGAGVLGDGRLRRRGAARGRRGGPGPRGRRSRSTGTATSRPGSSPAAITSVARPDVVTGSLDGPRRRLGRHLDRARVRARGRRSGRP